MSHLSQRTSILYCRLSDFNIAFKFQPIKIQHSATSCAAVIGWVIAEEHFFVVRQCNHNAWRKPNGLNLNFHSLQPHGSWLLFCIQTWSWNEMFFCLFICLFVSLFVCLFLYLYICLVCLCFCLLFFCLSVCQFVCMSVGLFLCSWICLFICFSARLLVCWSNFIFIFVCSLICYLVGLYTLLDMNSFDDTFHHLDRNPNVHIFAINPVQKTSMDLHLCESHQQSRHLFHLRDHS